MGREEYDRRYREANRERLVAYEADRYRRRVGHAGEEAQARAEALGLARAEQLRLGRLLVRAKYPGWTFTVEVVGSVATFSAFRSDPSEPGRLQRLGPWPIAADAGEEEVAAAALAAAVGVDGEGARDGFRFLG